MGTSVDRHSASTEFYKRAGYLPGNAKKRFDFRKSYEVFADGGICIVVDIKTQKKSLAHNSLLVIKR